MGDSYHGTRILGHKLQKFCFGSSGVWENAGANVEVIGLNANYSLASSSSWEPRSEVESGVIQGDKMTLFNED